MQYPSNEIGELYKTILREDGVDLSKNNVPESRCKGSYRKLIEKASQLKWDLVLEDTEDKLDQSEDPSVSTAKFSFDLESGCYATMMLRELMVTTMTRKTSPLIKQRDLID